MEENEISLYVNIKEDVFKIKHEEIVTDIRPNLGNFKESGHLTLPLKKVQNVPFLTQNRRCPTSLD